MLRICSALVLILALGVPALADIRGAARVIDGDTLAIGGQRVRLHGIDAPERDQPCEGAGRSWACGTWAAAELERLIAARPVRCAVLDTDRYGRAVARCHAGADDLGAALVEAGAAIAFRRYALDYVAQEDRARQARRGLWRQGAGAVDSPAAWRARARAPSRDPSPAAPAGCTIKGNISDAGRIYHRPGQRDYDRTRIDPARGERWFCSEAEARAAGWRPARR